MSTLRFSRYRKVTGYLDKPCAELCISPQEMQVYEGISTTSDAGLSGERRPNVQAECWQNLRFEPRIATHPSGTAPTRMRQGKAAWS